MKHPSQTADNAVNDTDIPDDSPVREGREDDSAASDDGREARACVAFFIHGTPGRGDDWSLVVSALEKIAPDCRVLTLDRPGFGERSGEASNWDFDGQIDLFERLLREGSDGQPLIIVGHSFGAALALGLADRLGDSQELAGLVLVSGVLDPNFVHQRWYHRLLKVPGLRMVFPQKLRRSAEEMSSVQRKLQSIDRYWDRCSVSVKLIHGDTDRVVVYENSEHVMERVGNCKAKLKRVHRGGHALISTHAVLIAETIASLAVSIEREREGAQ